LTPGESDFTLEFIFGIGREGLSPLERLLAGKSVGDTITLMVENDQLATFFEHLTCHVSPLLHSPPPFTMQIRVVAADQADSREVVKAIARLGGCGHGGCDCGCGG
jgi:hypothetical protein